MNTIKWEEKYTIVIDWEQMTKNYEKQKQCQK